MVIFKRYFLLAASSAFLVGANASTPDEVWTRFTANKMIRKKHQLGGELQWRSLSAYNFVLGKQFVSLYSVRFWYRAPLSKHMFVQASPFAWFVRDAAKREFFLYEYRSTLHFEYLIPLSFCTVSVRAGNEYRRFSSDEKVLYHQWRNRTRLMFTFFQKYKARLVLSDEHMFVMNSNTGAELFFDQHRVVLATNFKLTGKLLFDGGYQYTWRPSATGKIGEVESIFLNFTYSI